MASVLAHLRTHYPSLRLIVEPHTAKDHPGYTDLIVTQRGDEHRLGQVTSLVLTIGGDGTILHVSHLFSTGECPPVVSFSMGSLGFLLPFREWVRAPRTTYDVSTSRRVDVSTCRCLDVSISLAPRASRPRRVRFMRAVRASLAITSETRITGVSASCVVRFAYPPSHISPAVILLRQPIRQHRSSRIPLTPQISTPSRPCSRPRFPGPWPSSTACASRAPQCQTTRMSCPAPEPVSELTRYDHFARRGASRRGSA
jgi:hypothetical protein